jgi:hypothetical protein
MKYGIAVIACVTVLTGCMTTGVPVTRSLNNTPWGYQKVSSPVRAGEFAQRFEVRPGDCGSDQYGSDCDRNAERSEVASTVRWDLDDTVWAGGSLFVPRGFQTNDGWTHIIQFKSSNPKGLAFNPQPFSLTLTRGRFVATFGWLDASNEQQFEQVDFGPSTQLEGRWTDFQIGIGPDIGNNIVVYQNGRQIVSRPIRYLDAEDNYLKYGIYRTTANFTNTLVWDEIRLGSSRGEVALDLDSPVD